MSKKMVVLELAPLFAQQLEEALLDLLEKIESNEVELGLAEQEAFEELHAMLEGDE